MPSSDRSRVFIIGAIFATMLAPGDAVAQVQPRGFAVDRLYSSAPGAGWFVMDALEMRPGFGGIMALTLGYAHNPLRVRPTDGSPRLGVVSDQASADFGFAATYDRFRLYVNFNMPLVVDGSSGTVDGYAFAAPSVNPGSHPDTLSDARIGFDARLLGANNNSFRLGVSAQLFVPNGERSDYITDGSYRAMGRVLFAGDVGMFTYAGLVGIHVRPLDDAPTPSSPEGSEFLFGVAGGARFVTNNAIFVVGPELFGETAFQRFFRSGTTAVEGLFSGRLERELSERVQLRAKMGVGAGLVSQFGSPEWRAVFSVEVTGHAR
jgi:hypothetical protein